MRRDPLLGTSAQSTIMNAIIVTNLYTQRISLTPQRDQKADRAHKGCRALMPDLDAIAPVINGNNADPAWPKPAIHPIEPIAPA